MLALQETRDSARRDALAPSDVNRLEPSLGHVLSDQFDVVTNSSLHCNDEITVQLGAKSRAKFCDLLRRNEPTPQHGPVASRPVFLKEFGDYLITVRTEKKWKQQQASDIAARRGLTAVTYQRLRWLEEGKIKSPEPELLMEVADLYGLSYRALVDQFVTLRYGIHATGTSGAVPHGIVSDGHSEDVNRTLPPKTPGVSDGRSTEARVRERSCWRSS